MDQESADRYIEDANNLQAQIASMQALMQVQNHKARSIEDEMKELTKSYDQQMAKLKSDRDQLV